LCRNQFSLSPTITATISWAGKEALEKFCLFLQISTRVNFTQTPNSLPQKCSDFDIFPNMKKVDLTPAQLCFLVPQSRWLSTTESLWK
jgi:hypothetical protein